MSKYPPSPSPVQPYSCGIWRVFIIPSKFGAIGAWSDDLSPASRPLSLLTAGLPPGTLVAAHEHEPASRGGAACWHTAPRCGPLPAVAVVGFIQQNQASEQNDYRRYQSSWVLIVRTHVRDPRRAAAWIGEYSRSAARYAKGGSGSAEDHMQPTALFRTRCHADSCPHLRRRCFPLMSVLRRWPPAGRSHSPSARAHWRSRALPTSNLPIPIHTWLAGRLSLGLMCGHGGAGSCSPPAPPAAGLEPVHHQPGDRGLPGAPAGCVASSSPPSLAGRRAPPRLTNRMRRLLDLATCR